MVLKQRKIKQLKNIWSPSQTYKFPFQEKKDGAVINKGYAAQWEHFKKKWPKLFFYVK